MPIEPVGAFSGQNETMAVYARWPSLSEEGVKTCGTSPPLTRAGLDNTPLLSYRL